VKSGFFLDVVVRESSAVFKLFTSKDESLLVRRDSFFVLNFGFNVLNGVRSVNVKSNCFTSEGFDEDLHTTSKSEDKVECWLFLDVIVWESSSVFELFSCENKSLLIWRDSFFVLNFGFDVFDWVRGINIKSDGFTSEGLDKDLHSTSESEDKVECGFLLDVVVRKGSSVFKLFSSENKSLLIRRDSLFVLDFGFDVFNWVWGINIESDGFSSKSFDKDLHTTSKSEDKVECRFLLDVIIREGSSIF